MIGWNIERLEEHDVHKQWLSNPLCAICMFMRCERSGQTLESRVQDEWFLSMNLVFVPIREPREAWPKIDSPPFRSG